MKKTNPATLSLLYGILTLITVVVWIFFPNLAHYFGAASIMQLFVFAVASDNKYLFTPVLIGLLLFTFSLIFSIWTAYKKHRYKMFTVLMWSDVIISSFLLVYKLSTQNYSSILHLAFGILLRSSFVIYFSQIPSTSHS